MPTPAAQNQPVQGFSVSNPAKLVMSKCVEASVVEPARD